MGLTYNISDPRLVGRLAAAFVQESATGSTGNNPVNQEASLAQTLSPIGKNREINIIRDYRWTLSQLNADDIKEVPYIRLKEFKCTESSIKKQGSSFVQIGKDTFMDLINAPGVAVGFNSVLTGSRGVLEPYDAIWPLDDPTGFSYVFPYFNKVGFELSTEAWTSLDSATDSVKTGIEGFAETLLGTEGKAISKKINGVIDLVKGGSNLALNTAYPSVGVADRPKMFMSHGDRNINISFVLYNTFTEEDWPDNRDLCYLLMSQNLFNKRDSTTGVPPAFYTIFIPGQYFCRAACVTNIKIEHLGNQRLLNWGTPQNFIVPDAYQIDITLTELVKPSKNQFEAMSSGDAIDRVTVRTK